MNVTVNFTHAGKQMINCALVTLEKAAPNAEKSGANSPDCL
jgi:hypothetical protein